MWEGNERTRELRIRLCGVWSGPVQTRIDTFQLTADVDRGSLAKRLPM